MCEPDATAAITRQRGDPWTNNYTPQRRKKGFTGVFTRE